MRVAALRTASYTLKTLGEVPQELKEVLDNTVVAALSHCSPLVRVEAALTLRVLAEVDPSAVGGLISYAVTMLSAVRENISFEKGTGLKLELDSLHGEASILAALVSISPKLPLGYPARLPSSVLEVSKKMLIESSRNPIAAAVEKEAGWTLVSALLASMPKEEFEDQIFDILSLWASVFSGNANINQTEDLNSSIRVWAAAIDALTSFIKCFISFDDVNNGILLQPVLLYLSRALSYISVLTTKEQARDVFIIKTLVAYQSISDPTVYRSDHPRIIQICTTPFRDASRCEESSCLRMLLDKGDAYLGPWTPGRAWFEDELRSFQGGKDGVLPCLWENELSSFPQPESVSKMLVNQMLLCFGTMFASQDSNGMLSLLGMIEQCLKSGKRQPWHMASVTNICVGLLAGLKALLALRPEPLGFNILSAAQFIFQNILAEGDICASQRRASSEGLGLLARLGNDTFTARLTKLLLGDVNTITDLHYAGSIAFALGCIHRSAGGMALSSLVPVTVNSISFLAKSSMTSLQIWSLHGLLLTIEAAGLSYVSHVQATLALAMDILLSEESGRVDLQQGVGRLINAIVAVIGPELSPDSIFFSRVKSVVAEISSNQETATLLESVRFTQQLVLFAPQAVTVHSHVQALLPTLSSRQPTLRHLALSTLRHLIEKDPASISGKQIENALFHMLDEETDTEIMNVARTTIKRLLYASCSSCPSHWLSICRNLILSSSWRDAGGNNLQNDSSSNPSGEAGFSFGDEENMVSTSQNAQTEVYPLDYLNVNSTIDKPIRYRTRVFAAECLSHLPGAVGNDPAHFDLSIAREKHADAAAGNWLVLHLQDLISVAYQISTIQFENMRSIGVTILCTIVDKFEMITDPELPGRLLLEQYQAQLLSAVRTALDPLSGPILLEAGLQLAKKVLTSGVISEDQAAVRRIFSMISRPLNEFNNLYYPSFAEWASCKIKIRLLAAHASLKCYAYEFLRGEKDRVPIECEALLPLFSKNSDILGPYWLSVLRDYCYICFHLYPKKNLKPLLEGIQSSLVSSKLQSCLEEAWPVILQATVLDAAPEKFDTNGSSETKDRTKSPFISKYRMVGLGLEEYHFLWGFSLLVLFQGQAAIDDEVITPVCSSKSIFTGNLTIEDANSLSSKFPEIILPVIRFMCMERFFSAGYLTVEICREFMEVLFCSAFMDNTWDSLAASVLLEILQDCSQDFLDTESFTYLSSELCLAFLFKIFLSSDANSPCEPKGENMISILLASAAALLSRTAHEMQLKLLLPFILMGCKSIQGSSTELCLLRANDFFQSVISVIKRCINDTSQIDSYGISQWRTINQACLSASLSLSNDCIKRIHQLENKRFNYSKLLQMKLLFSLEHVAAFAKLAFEIEFLVKEQEDHSVLSAVLCQSNQCIQATLHDSDIQVQLIGLQVLRSLLQKGSEESNSFEIFFVVELVGDILTLIQKYFEKGGMNRESVAIVGECLKLLTLLQAVSKSSTSQKCLLNLLLEAIVMVFLVTKNHLSQEINELRNAAIKLVTQLAQSPLSSIHFKDVLLAMPIMQRQQLQDIIRASVNQELSSTQSMAPTLAIKLPTQKEESMESSSFPTAGGGNHDNKSSEEEDDDWDSFQSFPLPVNEDTSPSCITEKPNLTVELSDSEYEAKNSDIKGQSSSQSLCEVNEVNVAGEVNAERGAMLVSEANVNQTEVHHSGNGCCSTTVHQDNLQEESNMVMPATREIQNLKHGSEYHHYSNPAQRDGPGLDSGKVISAVADIQTPIEDVEVAAEDHESSESINTDQQDALMEKSNRALPANAWTESPTEHAEKDCGSCERPQIKMEPNSENEQRSQDVQLVEQSDSCHGNHPGNEVERHTPSEQGSSDPESAHPPEHPDDDHLVT